MPRAASVLALLVAACAAAPLSRHARTITVGDDPSTLGPDQRASFEASLGPVPTRDSVAARLAFVESGPASLSSGEARALLESTLDWIDLLREGWQPDWTVPAPPRPPRGEDVIGSLRDEPAPTASERLSQAIRATAGLIERAAVGPGPARAWRAAMISLSGTPDECPEDGEAGAVAAAIRAELDGSWAHVLERPAGIERSYRNEAVSCHVATLDGPVRVGPDVPDSTFARSGWARGGPADGQCTFGGGRGPRDPASDPSVEGRFVREWDEWLDSFTDTEVVVVTLGALAQAYTIVVARRDGTWRVIVYELAWTT